MAFAGVHDMFPLHEVPPVAESEPLTRFILFSRHVRSSDQTVKADAFMPHPLMELSLTRLQSTTDPEVWSEGERVAFERERTLYGRADVGAQHFIEQGLNVVAKPLPANPNHADAVGWPLEKSEQKSRALEIARQATYREKPGG